MPVWSSAAGQQAPSSSKPPPPPSNSSSSPSSPFPNFIHAMTASGLSPRAALSEAKEMLGPGTDTSSATLAHIMWALAHNPAYQDALFGDLARAGFPQTMSGGNSLDAVPKLKACVKEGVRWAGAAAAMLPRVVPDGGVVLEGVWVPGGVRGFPRVLCRRRRRRGGGTDMA
ncbi:hypothetical protein SLS55_004980 [Diplodia seriata]|uniref:Uncharacterized protein n=1 Tax=Diplodia seriata TaxID=420778 RepID=A0ABR3CKX5_9PEZI